jgi:hypothetical protein
MTEIKKVKLCAVVILFVCAATVISAIDLSKWQYCWPVTIQSNGSEFCRMDITPEIYNVAKQDLSDIRIIDSKGEQVPYLLAIPQDVTSKHTYSPTIINRSIGSKKSSMVTLDFGRQVMKNLIIVKTGGSTFRRAVKIEGSNDNVKFFTVVEQAFVFAVDNKEQFRFSDIDLPLNDYCYLRISVEPMATEKDSPVIEDVQAFANEQKLAERSPVNMLCLNHTEDDGNNLSVYEYDLVYRNLPVNEIKLSIADEYFYRQVTVEGRNVLKRKVTIQSEDNRERYMEVNEPWFSLTGGAVYRYISADGKKCERTVLPLSLGSRAYRYLKITIRNYDDKPLTVESSSVEMIAHKVVFAGAENTGNLLLYAGCDWASRPQYDITYKLSKPLEVAAASAMLGSVTANPLFGKVEQKTIPWTEQHKNILVIVMIVVVLVLGVFILKSFKSIKTEGNECNGRT